MTTQEFTYTGSGAAVFTVPAGVTELEVEAWGAEGGTGANSSYKLGNVGGKGAYAKGTLAVTPGETLHVYVGGSGASGGFNGGGAFGSGGAYGGTGGRGGGASDVRQGGTALANRKIVAGGGGGGGGASATQWANSPQRVAGAGGGGGYASGIGGAGENGGDGAGGTGGTQAAGGSVGGAAGTGGGGGTGGYNYGGGGGGGGGGYYGGGGGQGGNDTDACGGGGGGGSCYTGGVTSATTTNATRSGSGLVRITWPNMPPNAPELTSLTAGEVIDRANVNRASHSFSDPDAGDSQSAFDHRYRLVGSPTWTTAYVASPNSFVDYPAGTFAAGDYERQVRTYDSGGTVGAWSASGFFTAADAPADPTITDPIQNDTISAETADLTWSAPAQDAYQLQVLDGGLVEHDTGTVVTTQRTAYGVPFPDNNVNRSIRVRVRSSGLWSSWYTISVAVSFTRPPTPTLQLSSFDGTAIVVQVVNPAPGAGEPAVVQNDVFVTEDGQEQRRAVVTPNGSWTYWLPKAGIDYAQLVRVEAIGDNGTRSSS